MKQLRQLGIMELAIRYAEVIEPGKVKHYRVGITRHMTSSKEEMNERLSKFIGDDVEITYPPEVIPNPDGSMFKVKDLKDLVSPAVNKILNRKKSTNLLLQHRMFKPGFKNYLLSKVEQLLMKIPLQYRIILQFKYHLIPSKLIVAISNAKEEKVHYSPCRFFSIETTDKNAPKAIKALEDLVIQNKDRIIAALAPISELDLSDTVGDGQKRRVIFTFFHIKENERVPMDMTPISKYETREGEIGDSNEFTDKPEIEVVDVVDDGTNTLGVQFEVKTNYTLEAEVADQQKAEQQALEAALAFGEQVDVHADGVIIK